MELKEAALALHREHRGKLAVQSKVPVTNNRDLSLAYSPGVAEPCRAIAACREAIYEYTAKGNLVAVASDGSAVLGLGNIGPGASLPVMEGKAVLFKTFGGVDAFPLCLATQDVDEFVRTLVLLAPTFGGINLEDIAAPRCFEIEAKLQAALDIPVFHDDQHGTAVVAFAGLLNALKLVGKQLEQIKVVINGAGAAGQAIAKLLLASGVREIIVCDRKGALVPGRSAPMDPYKTQLAALTNPQRCAGSLHEVLAGADVFIGVSEGNILTTADVATMAPHAIIFALANPEPEIWPDLARAGGAQVIATGRSDLPNQVNNVLGFPGIFRGALDVRATCINEEMKMAAAQAIASLITPEELNNEYVIPNPFDTRVAIRVAEAVAAAARATGVARL